MMFNQFNGIRPLVDGMVDADYHNCVPTGESIVERTNYEYTAGGGSVEFSCRYVMDSLINSENHNEVNIAYNVWNGSHVNFLKAIQVGDLHFSFYISKPEYVDITQEDNTKLYFPRLFIVQHAEYETSTSASKCWSTPIVFAWNGFEIDPETMSVCVSGTSPRYLFIGIKGCATYWINIEDTKSYPSISYKSCRAVGCLANPNAFLPTEASSADNDDVAFTLIADFYMAASLVANRTSTKFNNVDWYDNKLVISYDNSVWMTKTDPTSLFSTDYVGHYDPSQETWNWKQYDVDNMWINAYKSTLSYDTLSQVRSCYGQLFFINEKSIEMWIRSGNESDPLNPVSSYVTNVDVVKCDVLDGRLVALINEGSKLRVALLDSQGNANKISNQAVEKKLGYADKLTYNRFTTIVQNNENHIALYKIGASTTSFMCFNPTANAWYTLEYNNIVAPLYQLGKFAINSKYGYLKVYNRCGDWKTGAIDNKYERRVKDIYQSFTERRLISNVEVYGQFGVGNGVENDDKIMLQTSNTQGVTWTPERWRNPPRLGQFQPKIVFNGLGSGDSIMLQLKWFNIKPYVINGININAR